MTADTCSAKPLTSYHIKCIALLTMVIDHVGAVFFPQLTFLRAIGRISFPLYAFLIAEGCRYTRDRGRYALRLGIFALVSEFPYDLALYPETLTYYNLWGANFFFRTNIFYTMFFAVASIHIFEVLRHHTKRAQLAALGGFVGVYAMGALLFGTEAANDGRLWRLYAAHLIVLAYYPLMLWVCHLLERRPGSWEEKPPLRSQPLAAAQLLLAFLYASSYGSSYGALGVLLILLAYLPKSRKMQAGAMGAWILYYYGLRAVGALLQGTMGLPYMLGRLAFALGAAALVYFAYNGQRGRQAGWIKWAFYAFYPVHLAVLAAVRTVLGL